MKKNSFPFFSIPFFLCFIEGLIVLTVNLLTPSEVQSHFLFGLSLQRFLIMGVVLFVSLAFLWLAWDSFQKKEWFEKFALLLKEKPGTGILFWLFFGVGFIFFNLLLVPDYQWGDSLSLSNRFRPVMVWVMLIGLQFGIYLTINSLVPRKNEITILFKDNRSFLRLFLIIICIFLAVWGWMAWSGMGIYPDVTFWNVPGVPLLIIQVYIVILVGGGLFSIEKSLETRGKCLPRFTDFILCLLIFISASLIWNLTPQKSTVFAPGPYSPNDAFYPHSDASVYNLSAQLALVGAGYNSPIGCPDKSLYITLLTWLNFLAGLDQKVVIILQVCVIALLPVLIYLIGKTLNSRTLGIMAAFLAVFKESNAILSSSFISTSMSKMMMSELPTAIFMAAMIYCLVLWVKSNGQKIYLTGLMGGLIGLSTLMRLTMNIFIPLVMVIIGIVLFKNWKKICISWLFFMVVLISSVLPWNIRVQDVCQPNKPFYYLSGPLQSVIWQNRYNRAEPAPVVSPTPAVVMDNNQLAAKNEVQTPAPVADVGYPSIEEDNDQDKSKITPPGKWLLDAVWNKLGPAGNKLEFISGHFFHNFLTTTLIFPTTLQLDDLQHIADPLTSLWSDRNWDGKMTPLAVGMHILTLSLIALGLARTWQEWKLAGLIPFLVYLTFCLGLAAARTSGGRYIIPIDWIQYLYYAAGVLVVVEWIIQLFHPGTRVSENLNRPVIQSQTLKSQYISCALVWLFILLWGLSIPGTEKMFAPLTFTPPSRAAIQDMLKNGGFSNGAIYENQLVTYTGRAISPRFFFFRQDILPGGAVGVPLSYPRFSFILIGANVPTLNIVLPTREIPAGIKNGTVVSVAGCPSEYGLEAVLLKIGEHIYFRNPKLDTLSCPLPEIKCNVDDRTCH